MFADDFSSTFIFREETTCYQLNASSFINPSNFLNLSYTKSSLSGKADIHFQISDIQFTLTPYVDSLYQSSDQSLKSEALLSSGFGIYDFDNFSIHFGKEIISWGTAYAWNPTNTFVPLRDFQNLNRQKMGIQALQIYYYLEQNFTITTVAAFDQNKFSSGVKFYGLIQDTDLNFSLYGGESKKTTAGFSFAKVFGEDLELHSEIACQKGAKNIQDDYSKFYINFVIGGQYTTLGNTNIILEYYHQNEELNLFQYGYQFANYKQNYLFLRIAQPDFLDKTDAHLMSFYNMDDQSSVILSELIYKWNPMTNIYLNAALFFGSNDSEFKSFYDHSITFGAEVFF